ncbi:putative carboxypeptidase [Holospora obtusa F1]|uniref:Carboxypeptidase n=1 Tax=Holospora obtusa F1 TaxID=1399147 RepID=W6TDW5_HOLOB|nr:LD-carboxypeptidase [Holospora obtusa]ETZ06996.1 putative carboxypeptidase [Holospora obtusa F1]
MKHNFRFYVYFLLSFCLEIKAVEEKSLKFLKRVEVVAPAGSLKFKDFSLLKSVFSSLKLLSWAPEVYWHSASDEDRGAQLLNALTQKKSLWVWCLRGGYGCARIIPMLEAAVRQKKLFSPKVIIGYSDITCLHLWADSQGWKSLHASMPGDWVKPCVKKNNFVLLNDILEQPCGVLEYKNLEPFNQSAKEAVLLKGKIIGGNLTLLVHSIGTSWQLQSQGKIIIIEDLNIQGYQIDRALYHLTQAGVLCGAVAIIFGTFSGNSFDWKKALKRFAKNTKIPVFYWPYFGHDSCNYPIPFGFESRVECVTKKWIWSIPYHFSKS